MRVRLDSELIQQTIDKNNATSYGLTLAVGLPFPAEISLHIQQLQQELEDLLPGRFTWYGTDHLHATLIAPLRGRYREQPPLQRDELPHNFQDLVCDLASFFSQCSPFSLELAGVYLSGDGLVMVREETLQHQLSTRLQRYPELDQPKRLDGLHVTIGFLSTARVFGIDEDQPIEQAIHDLGSVPVGSMSVRQVWLVHYANRTLGRIVGKVPFALGQSNVLNAQRLLYELGIIDVHRSEAR